MAQQFLCITSSDDGSVNKEQDRYQVLELGARDRVKTYYNGVIRGLLLAGFKVTHGSYSTFAIARKDEKEYRVYFMSEQEWKDF